MVARHGTMDVTMTREEPSADALWVAEIERRAGEIAQGKVTLIDAEDVHAEAAKLLRKQSAR
jgi:hypothetical protein